MLHHQDDYKTYFEMTNGITLEEFEKLANEMSERFGVNKAKIRLISYSWYNGLDEPVYFD